jgi:hypothetical protein
MDWDSPLAAARVFCSQGRACMAACRFWSTAGKAVASRMHPCPPLRRPLAVRTIRSRTALKVATAYGF